jgi:DNA polymerase III delta prime subunit
MFKGEWSINVSYQRADMISIYDSFNNTFSYYICAISHVSDGLVNPRNPEEIYWIEVKSIYMLDMPKPPALYKRKQRVESEEQSELVIDDNPKLKRKIKNIEKDISLFKKKRKVDDSTLDLKQQIMLLDVDIETKIFLLDKYDSIQKLGSSDYAKGKTWLKTVLNIPFGKYKPFKVKISDSSDKINEYFKMVRSHLDKNVHNMDKVKDEIMEFLARKISNPHSKGHVLALCGPPGVGKCFSKDTPILMFNGTIKMVQDVEEGDLLMGDDSTQRKVLSLGRGRDTMYKITNIKGESYTVNSEHIICLKYSTSKNIVDDKKYKRFRVKWFNNKDIQIDMKNFYYKNKDKNVIYEEAKEYLNNLKEDKICEISIKKYLKLSQSIKDKLKGYSVSINFVEKELDFDPYIIGLWLGDGDKKTSGISCQDATILKYVSSTLPKYECYLQYSGHQYDYRINGLKNEGWNSGGNNRMLNSLKQHNMIKNKHIPLIYKCNSRQNRLKLLAGLIDSDGYLSHSKSDYQFCQSLEHEELIDDVIYLCRSLGFACYKNKKQTSWTYQGVKKYGEAWAINISGEGIEEIPVLCPRKKSNSRQQIKDVLVSSIKVEELVEDNYYGFMIDGNERFVLGNFIVTHNTKILKSLAEALELPFYQVNFGGLNDVSVLTGHSETYVASKPGKFVEILTSAGCMNPIIYLDEIDKISEHKGREINGILTHVLDEEQNNKFQDNYLSNININLSRALFVIAFNEHDKVDRIVSDRMKIIYIDSPSVDAKVTIAADKMIPDIINTLNIKKDKFIILDNELLKYVIESKVPKEEGVRQLRKCLEKLFNRINYLFLTGQYKESNLSITKSESSYNDVNDNLSLLNIKETETETVHITKSFIDNCLDAHQDEIRYSHMYV